MQSKPLATRGLLTTIPCLRQRRHRPQLGGRGLARVALANARGFATQIAQIVKLGASHVASFHHVDVIDDRRVQRKDSFDTDTKAGFANGDRFARHRHACGRCKRLQKPASALSFLIL